MAAEEIRADLLLGRDTLSPGMIKAGRAAADASGNVRDLTKNLYELGKQRATPVVDLNDKAAELKLKDVTAKLDELGKKAANPGIDVKDKDAVAKVAAIRVKLDQLGNKVASPRVTLEGVTKVEAQLLALDAQMSRLGKERTGGGILSRIRGLFGGGGGAAGGAEGGLLSTLGSGLAAGGASPYLYGAGGLLAALLAPSALPLALGLGVGGAGILGAFKAGKKAQTELQKLQTALGSAKGKQKQALQQQIRQLQSGNAGTLGFYDAAQHIVGAVNETFSAALSATGAGFSGGAGGHPGGLSFLASVSAMFKQIAGFIKTLKPELGDLFRASVPYLQMFVKFLEQAAKTLLPVFTRMLIQFQPFLPLISKGLMNIVQGFAGFLKAIGPQGMQASAKIFVLLTKIMASALTGLGQAIEYLAKHVPIWAHNIAAWWDRLRHDTAASFDAMKRAVLDWWGFWVSTWHKIVNAASSAWAILTKGIRDALKTAARLFSGFPDQVVHALLGLGSKLWHLGAGWITSMWNGIKSVWKNVLGFFENLPGAILHAIGIHSPPDWAVSAGEFIMKGLHIGMNKASGLPLGFAQVAAGAIGGALGGGAAKAQAIAAKMLGAFGWGGGQFAPLVALWNRESGWNRFARNPTSGAYGIPQALPPTKMPFAAQAAGGSNAAAQIAWGLSYIKGRYGSPANAWAHEMAMGWYDRGGWLKPGLTLALNTTGRPEPVGYGHGAGTPTVNNYITVHVGHGTHPVAAAQEIAKVLNQGARNGVKLRTSILGPG